MYNSHVSYSMTTNAHLPTQAGRKRMGGAKAEVKL